MATTISDTATYSRPAGASLRRFNLLLQTNVKMHLRERTGLFWTIVFPIVLMLLFGAMWGNQKLNDADPNSPTFISYLAPGLVAMSIISSGLVGNAIQMAAYRERKLLQRVQSTPLPVWQLLFAYVIVQMVMMVLQAYLLLTVAALVLGAHFEIAGLLLLLPLTLLGALVFMMIGQAVAAVVSRAKTVNGIIQVINLPLMFLGSIWIPANQLPATLITIGKFLPSTMLADLARRALIDSRYFDPILPLGAALLGLCVYLAVAVLISVRFFKWR